jgi:hypothetical protein
MSQDTDDLARAWLEPAGGDHGDAAGGAGSKLPLTLASATFGRVPGNTHVLADKTVSRQHAKVFVRDGRHWIADQNSTAGTFVNGQKVSLQTLTDGDEIRLGTTLLRYRLPGVAPAASALAVPAAPPPPAARPPGAPVPLAEPPTGAFELELPDANPPPRRPTAPIGAPPPRSGLTAAGEDPFAENAPPRTPGDAPTSERSAARAPTSGAKGAAREASSIELRGATARNFGMRGAAPAGAPLAASSSRAATTHLPPPIVVPPKRSGAFAFAHDDLDQRGGLARFAAITVALAAALGLGWLALRAFERIPKSVEQSGDGEDAPSNRPTGPELPPKR